MADNSTDKVCLDYETARDLLGIINAQRGGPRFSEEFLLKLIIRVARQMPEEELPAYLGGPSDDEEE